MKVCGTLTPAGLSDCNARLKAAIAMIISVKGTSYTEAELATLTKTKSNVSLAAGIVSVYLPLSGFTLTTDAPEIVKSPAGTKGVYDDQIPSGTAFLDRSFEDYQTLWNANNSVVEVEFITKDGKRVMTEVGNGTFKGFRAEIYAEVGIPKADAPLEAHPIHIFFKDVNEFLNMTAKPMAFSHTAIADVVPIGLSLSATAAYTGGSIATKATKRGTNVGKAGLMTWVILDSNVSTPAVTVTDSGLGVYSLAVTKSSVPEALVAGDYVTVQGYLLASTFATYITEPLTIWGA